MCGRLAGGRETNMDHTYRVTEIVGSSSESIEQAIRNAVQRAGQTVRRLAGTETASTVRVGQGGAEVTDGPFVESKEHLAGYYVVDVKDLDRALALAARIPDARFGAVEVRPVLDMSGAEM